MAVVSVTRISIAAITGIGLAVLGNVAMLGAPTSASAKKPPATVASNRAGFAPDPPQVANTRHWVFDIDVKAGVVSLKGARSVEHKQARPTKRVFGRYALEFWIGNELLDRIRFNVPGAGDPRPEDRNKRRPISFDRVNTQLRVNMADNDRTTYLKLVDRATGEAKRFPWPLELTDAGGSPSAADAAGRAGDAGNDAAAAPDSSAPDAAADAGDGGP